jgi:hypothetical protein
MVVNKADLAEVRARHGELEGLFGRRGLEPLFVSAAEREGTQELVGRLAEALKATAEGRRPVEPPVIRPRPLGRRFEVRRFRPNIVLRLGDGETGFVENSWVGRTLSIGEGVRVRITAPCSRCVMTTLPQGDLPQDGGILRTAAKHNKTNVGVYGVVDRGGRVRRGDPIQLV